MAIVCFDLIPEALEITNVFRSIIGIIFGIIIMLICDILVEKKFNSKYISVKANKRKNLLKVGTVIAIGLALHNIPEGLAIGSGFDSSIKLGLSLAFAICFHDIPEGISMAVPMKEGGIKSSKVILYVVLSGIATGLGAFIGAIIGTISEKIIAMCLSFAARCNAVYSISES